MGWIVALGVLTLLALMPIGVRILYNEDGLMLAAMLGPVKLQLLPAKKKKRPAKEKGKKAQTKQEQKAAPEKQEKKGGSLTDFIPLVKTAWAFLGGFFKALRIKLLDVHLLLAGEDPCDLAVNYGRTWSAVGTLIPLLDRLFVIKKRQIDVECDFTAEQSLIRVQVDLAILFGPLLVLLVRYGTKLLMQYIGISNKRKGGVAHEPESP